MFMMAVIIHIPNLGGQTIPNQVRIALGIVLAVILVPMNPLPATAESMALLTFAFAILKEIIIGKGLLSNEQLEVILSPKEMTKPGIAGRQYLKIS